MKTGRYGHLLFGTAQEAREYLVGFGFEPFRKGMVKGTLTAPNGKRAQLGMCLLSKTGQSSRGTGASWGYSVLMEEAA